VALVILLVDQGGWWRTSLRATFRELLAGARNISASGRPTIVERVFTGPRRLSWRRGEISFGQREHRRRHRRLFSLRPPASSFASPSLLWSSRCFILSVSRICFARVRPSKPNSGAPKVFARVSPTNSVSSYQNNVALDHRLSEISGFLNIKTIHPRDFIVCPFSFTDHKT